MMYGAQAQPVRSARRFAGVKPATARPLVLFAGDLSAVLVAVFAAWALHVAVAFPRLEFGITGLFEQGLNWHGWGTLLVLAVLLTYFASHGHYTVRMPAWAELKAVIIGTIIAMLCDSFIRIAVYDRVLGFEAVARWMLFGPVLLLFRQMSRSLLDVCGLWRMRTVVIGSAEAVRPVRAAFNSESRLSYDLVWSIAFQDLTTDLAPGWGANLLAQADAEFAVVAGGVDQSGAAAQAVRALARERIPFAIVPGFGAVPVSNISSECFPCSDVVLLKFGNNLTRPISRVVKTLFDQAVALLLLVLLAPLLLVIAALVRADGGPALYGHRRLGENGRHFPCLKFRSMVTDGDAVLQALLDSDAGARAEWAATQKLRNDPRVTAIGRILRKTSLDELPQLLNVLRREMSLVGPRPIVDAEVERYGHDISFYYETRPGITGLWQVSGRSNTSYEERVRMDVWYVRNWSLWHDFSILIKTIPAVLAKDGAV